MAWRMQSRATQVRNAVWLHKATGRITGTEADNVSPPNIAVPKIFLDTIQVPVMGMPTVVKIGVDDDNYFVLSMHFPSGNSTYTHANDLTMRLVCDLERFHNNGGASGWRRSKRILMDCSTAMYDANDTDFYKEDASTRVQIDHDTITLVFMDIPSPGLYLPETPEMQEIVIGVGRDLAAKTKSELLYQWQLDS